MAQTRIYSLDYLRGLAALAIMFFHLTSWTYGKYNSEDLMGRIGIYGVSVFYILSGLTLYLIYFNTLKPEWRNLITFGIKRTFRIFPLLWLTVGLTLWFTPKLLETHSLFLSLTGLFGFLKPADGIGTGVWSIGNEFVFYTVFPVLVLIGQKSRPLFLIIAAILISLTFYFAFFVFDVGKPIAPQWPAYVNPLNQLVLFVGGMLLGYFFLKFPNLKFPIWLPLLVLAAAWLLFIFYPASGDRIALVAGWNRVFFLLFSFLICGAVYFLNFKLPTFLHRPLTLTAEISFGLYLLHPIVYFFFTKHAPVNLKEIDPALLVLGIAVLAYIFSWLAFRFIEIPVVNLGKFFTEKLKKTPSAKNPGQVPFL